MIYYGYDFVRESDLTHHGIKGQKWGIRRFQNKDGSLTAAGKKHQRGTSGEPEHISNKASTNLKKAAKIGAAVIATGLAAYGAYKLNSKVTANLIEDSVKLGRSYLNQANFMSKAASEMMNLADRSRFLSDKDLSKAAFTYNKHQAENYDRDAVNLRNLGFQNIRRAQSGRYTAAEKAEMLARMVSRRR